MRINGRWLVCPDGIARPILLVEVLAGDGTWREALFMVDTGADRTVFAAPLLAELNLPATSAGMLVGVGGAAPSMQVTTKIRMKRDDGALQRKGRIWQDEKNRELPIFATLTNAGVSLQSRDDGGLYTIHSRFDAFTDLSALDMSVLGRNVLGLFAVIVDQPHDVVCFLAERHQYVIHAV